MAETVTNTIQFPYRRSLGPVFGTFMTALTEKRILGIRCGPRVLVPPLEWDPETAESLEHDFVEVGPGGTVTSFTWVAEPTEQHPLDRPFAFALIRLDGADTDLLHAVDAGTREALSAGTRVAPRWRRERRGRIDDIECFVPGEEPETAADGGPSAEGTSTGGGADGVDRAAGGDAEGVTMMDYAASITYRDTAPANALAVVAASREQRLVGHRCPVCGRTYTAGRAFCPVDAIELGPAEQVELPQSGVVTNFTVVTPVQYPGQTETEPFVRAMVMLEGTAGHGEGAAPPVVLTYQPILELPASEVRVGLRVSARWAPPDTAATPGGGMGGAVGLLEGWAPTGQPDVADPDLVNRIF